MNSLTGKAVQIDDQHLHVELKDGRMMSTSMKWYPELKNATLAQLTAYRFICRGTCIEWPELDYHLSIEAMFADGRMPKAV